MDLWEKAEWKSAWVVTTEQRSNEEWREAILTLELRDEKSFVNDNGAIG